MLPDKPLDVKDILSDPSERESILHYISVIDRITDSAKGSISISVNGEWGSGKTTYLKVFESFYRDYCRFPVLFYEAWKHQDEENPLIPLILELRDMSGINSKFKGRFTSIIKSFIAAGLSMTDILLKANFKISTKEIKEHLKFLEDQQVQLTSRHRSNIRLFENTINDVRKEYEYELKKEKLNPWLNYDVYLKQHTRYDNKQLFVLIIDDLDRLITEKAFKLIETLRFYFDIDNVLIIMGINDEILNSYVEEHYGATSGNVQTVKGERFLEKIFQLSLELSASELNDFHLKDINKSVQAFKGTIHKVLLNTDHLSHRKWVKLINRIEKEIEWIRRTRREVTENQIFKVVFNAFVKELYPSFEVYQRRFPKLLDLIHAGDDDKKMTHITKEGLKKITEDRSYLHFPSENFETIKKVTEIVTKNI